MVLPFRAIERPTLRRLNSWQEAASAVIISGLIALFFYASDVDGFGSIVASVVVVLGLVGGVSILIERRYVHNHRSSSDVLLDERNIYVSELTPFQWRAFRHDSLAICRLRIIELPDRFSTNVDHDHPTQPRLWDELAVSANGEFALVAEGENGRRLFIVAVAYPRVVIVALARRLKRELDLLRERHHAEVKQHYPDARIPEPGSGIPICVGDRFTIAKLNPIRPAETKIVFCNAGGSIEFEAPRGEALESVKLSANTACLLVERQLVLGRLETRIAAEDLLDVRAEGTEHEGTDSVRLVIEYYDTVDLKIQQLVLLSDYSFEEVAWIAAELNSVYPKRATAANRFVANPWRFSIAQIMFFTVIAAAVCGSFSFSYNWGWLYALQIIAAVHCVVSFCGVKSLGRIARRSWSMSEIFLACIALGFLWLIRFVAWMAGN